MGDHSMAMMGACLAILVTVAILLVARLHQPVCLVPGPSPRLRTPAKAVLRLGRHPPDEGTILLC